MKKIKLSFILLLLFTVQAFAQLTMSGEFRPRTEYKHGYKALAGDNTKMNLSTNQRTRLNIDFKTESYQFFVSLQDVRLWGDEKQLVSADGAHTTLHQAFAQINFSEKFALKAGRQEIILDDHRIFGSVGWAPQARSHDAAIFKFNSNGFKADLGLAFNLYENETYLNKNNYKAFQYIWLHKSFGNFSASLLALNNGKLDNSDNSKLKYSQTFGTRSGYKAGKFSAFMNAYYQMGKTPGNNDIKAHLIGLDLGYKINSSFSVGFGFEQQSGNKMQQDTSGLYINSDNVQNAFTPFYGTNHKFNGHMDYFYVGNHGGHVGLNDIFFKLSYKKNKLGLAAHVHYFMAANTLTDATGTELDPALGTEIDLSASYPLAKGVGFKLGYSHMLGTDSMVALKGGSTDAISNWGWMMIVIKPTLFTNAK